MAELINMPKLGFDMREGQLINWLVGPGDTIEKGSIIAEIESDKATIEVESFSNGTVLELLVAVEDWVPIGAPIAVIGDDGESYDLAALGVEADEPEEEAAPAAESTPAPAQKQPEQPQMDSENGFPGGLRASPLARKIADDLGIDLQKVSGSGPMGRIVRADVESYEEVAGEAPAAPASAGAPLTVGHVPVNMLEGSEATPMSRIRERIGERMVQAKLQVPHFYVTTEIDMEAAMALRKQINGKLEADGIKVSVNDFMIKAAALALKQYPNLNASFNGDSIVHHSQINVGIAVALDDGLMNVVSKSADKATLATMAVNHKDMILRAREGKVRPEDVEGETFAVSNLGPWDVDHFIAIINPPAAGILALGTAKKIPVVLEDGTLGVGWRMKATVSADHRVTDGAEAAAFVQYFKQLLEDPIRLLV